MMGFFFSSLRGVGPPFRGEVPSRTEAGRRPPGTSKKSIIVLRMMKIARFFIRSQVILKNYGNQLRGYPTIR
jgi:hypothetical protein